MINTGLRLALEKPCRAEHYLDSNDIIYCQSQNDMSIMLKASIGSVSAALNRGNGAMVKEYKLSRMTKQEYKNIEE